MMADKPITEEWLRSRAHGHEDAGTWYVPGFVFRGHGHRIVVVQDFNLWKWSVMLAGYSGPQFTDRLEPLREQPQTTLDAVRLLATYHISVME